MNVIKFPEKKQMFVPIGYRVIKSGEGFLAQKKGLFWYGPFEYYKEYQNTYDDAVQVCWFEKEKIR